MRNGILPMMAERVMAKAYADATDCQYILREDIEKAWPNFDPRNAKGQKKRVGF